MAALRQFRSLSANGRFGVVALVLAAVGLSVTIRIEGAVPLQLLFLGLTVFGQWAYGQEAGFEKPLTKLVMVAFCFATLGFVLLCLQDSVGGGLLFAFAGVFAILFWALAMLHRPGPARAAGKAGIVAGGVSLAALIGGHIFVGLGAAMGFGVLRNAASATAQDVQSLVQLVCLCVGGWGLACAWLMFKGHLRQS